MNSIEKTNRNKSKKLKLKFEKKTSRTPNNFVLLDKNADINQASANNSQISAELQQSIGDLMSTIQEQDWYNKIHEQPLSPDPKHIIENEGSPSQRKIVANIRQ